MKLADRIGLQNILPAEGTYIDLVLAKDIKEKVEISQEEAKEKNVRREVAGENVSTLWDKEKDVEVEVEFTDAEKAFISKAIKALEEKGKLHFSMIALYEIFCK